LGSGDSGKSTFLRQIKHLMGVDVGLDSEKIKFTSVIKHNCLKSMKDFLNWLTQHDHEIPPKLQPKVDQVINSEGELNEDIGMAIEKIWSNKKIKATFQKVEVQLLIPTNSQHFWKMAKEVSSEDYSPSKDDIIQSKIRTIGIQETRFEFEGLKFLMVDVGGQRSERRKWLHCFNNINAVIFLTAIDEYDGKVLEEDNHTNRMLDSQSLFEKISESSWFEGVPFILFLNKIDLFQNKIKTLPLDKVFDDFNEVIKANDKSKLDKYKQSIFYMSNLFLKRFKGDPNSVFTFETNSTDEDICNNVFNSIKQDVLMKKLVALV